MTIKPGSPEHLMSLGITPKKLLQAFVDNGMPGKAREYAAKLGLDPETFEPLEVSDG